MMHDHHAVNTATYNAHDRCKIQMTTQWEQVNSVLY
jgi:hypothetical protein